MEEKNVNITILKELYANRWKIMLTTVFFLALSLVVYFITPPKYTSNAIVYPTSSNSIDEVVANPSFGFEIQADRTIQLFESQMMKDRLVEKFDLITYYELDTNSSKWYSQLNKNYARDISFSRTKYQSVVVNVTMKDPFLAANIANEAITYIDTIQKSLFLENLQKIKTELENAITTQQSELDQMLVNILFLDSSLNQNNPIAINKLNQLKFKQQTGQSQSGDAIIIDALQDHPGFLLEKQINNYYIKLNTLNSLKNKLEEVKKTINLPFPGVYTVSKARPDETPTSPKLLWNLLFGFLIGLMFSIAFIFIKHNLKSITEISKN